MFEYKPVDRLNARPEGDNTGDLKWPFAMLALVLGAVGLVLSLLFGLVKLFT